MQQQIRVVRIDQAVREGGPLRSVVGRRIRQSVRRGKLRRRRKAGDKSDGPQIPRHGGERGQYAGENDGDHRSEARDHFVVRSRLGKFLLDTGA